MLSMRVTSVSRSVRCVTTTLAAMPCGSFRTKSFMCTPIRRFTTTRAFYDVRRWMPNRTVVTTATTNAPGAALPLLWHASRLPRTKWWQKKAAQEPNSEGAEEQQNTQQQQQEQQDAADKDSAGGKSSADEEKKPPEGFFGHLRGLGRDVVKYPDIYNAPNMLNFTLWTMFCLCSTGSNVELEWWNETWGIDAAFRPSAWILHSLMMNNFLTVSFAMMLVHSMCHSVLPTIGNRGLLLYIGLVSLATGICCWLFNAYTGNRREKQFGPWDFICGLFVMQYLHQGFSPALILNSFTGWVRWACWVGAVCIAYYDWQLCLGGTFFGLLLCRTRFKAMPIPK